MEKTYYIIRSNALDNDVEIFKEQAENRVVLFEELQETGHNNDMFFILNEEQFFIFRQSFSKLRDKELNEALDKKEDELKVGDMIKLPKNYMKVEIKENE